MSIHKCAKQTKHARVRGAERLGVMGSRQFDALARAAQKKGIAAGTILDEIKAYKKQFAGSDSVAVLEPLRLFLTNKTGAGKRVKVYKGIVFVFNRTSDRCLTCYKLPKELLDVVSILFDNL